MLIRIVDTTALYQCGRLNQLVFQTFQELQELVVRLALPREVVQSSDYNKLGAQTLIFALIELKSTFTAVTNASQSAHCRRGGCLCRLSTQR
jgi:hypothetical protein